MTPRTIVWLVIVAVTIPSLAYLISTRFKPVTPAGDPSQMGSGGVWAAQVVIPT